MSYSGDKHFFSVKVKPHLCLLLCSELDLCWLDSPVQPWVPQNVRMTSRDPTCLLLAWDDETPTDVRRDCFALKVNIWLPLLKFSLLEAGLRDNTNTGRPGGRDSTAHWESAQLIFFHLRSLNKQSQQDRDRGTNLCCETKGRKEIEVTVRLRPEASFGGLCYSHLASLQTYL